MTTPDNGPARCTPRRSDCSPRCPAWANWTIEDMLLSRAHPAPRLISQRQMKRLYEAFGEEAVKAVLAE